MEIIMIILITWKVVVILLLHYYHSTCNLIQWVLFLFYKRTVWEITLFIIIFMTNVLIFILVGIIISVAKNQKKCQIGDPSEMASTIQLSKGSFSPTLYNSTFYYIVYTLIPWKYPLQGLRKSQWLQYSWPQLQNVLRGFLLAWNESEYEDTL